MIQTYVFAPLASKESWFIYLRNMVTSDPLKIIQKLIHKINTTKVLSSCFKDINFASYKILSNYLHAIMAK